MKSPIRNMIAKELKYIRISPIYNKNTPNHLIWYLCNIRLKIKMKKHIKSKILTKNQEYTMYNITQALQYTQGKQKTTEIKSINHTLLTKQ